MTVYSKESILYVKRMLKLYHIPDMQLLTLHKLVYPKRSDIDLEEIVDKINASFNDEVELMLQEPCTRYIKFLAKNTYR